VTHIFVKHRQDGKYEVRFSAREREDYRRLRGSLYAYISADKYEFDHKARTWVVEGECGKEIERWLARMIEDLSPSVEFFCERQDTWEEAVKESYRVLHLRPSAPWEMVHAAYLSLIELWRTRDGDMGRLERIKAAYERLRQELKKDDSSESES
jgi:hypothetical protein